MKLLVWNCQGLRSPWRVRALNELIRLHNLSLVFLSETKCRKRKCEILKERYNMFGLNLDSQGKCGGLMLLWRKDINLVVHSLSQSHIDACVSNLEGVNGWRFTGIYGQLDAVDGMRRGVCSDSCVDSLLGLRFVLVAVLVARGSDHSPLIIDLEALNQTGSMRRRKMFHFEAMWARSAECEVLIHDLLSQEAVGDVGARILQHPISVEAGAVKRRLRSELEELLTLEEILWKQQGKAQWLNEGIETLLIFMLEQVRGNSSSPSEEAMDKVVRGMPARVSESMNEALIQPFTPDEVKLAVSQMYPYKSLWPDTFIPGRLISDNVLIAYVLNHHLAHKTWGSKGHAALKLDLSKAYDRVEWIFLERVLSYLISTAVAIEEVRGVAVSRCGPRVSYLLFTDDTLLFCQASVAFSCNAPRDVQQDLASILGVQVVNRHVKYLGLPALVGRSKREVFQNLKDKVWARLQSWRCKNLSQVGKRARPGCSFTWRSIIAAKDVIASGMRWQVGSGCSIHIWKDRWIPRPLSFQVITTPNTLSEEATVNELLTTDGDWNEDLLRAIFRGDDVNAIVGISQAHGRPDLQRWHYEKTGIYSVKSAYWLISKGLIPHCHYGPTGSKSYKKLDTP
ncbi:UNVERIFIED_CONTAM: hypothetical protein Sradi_4420900 [Sesamum radiatum]|uniref:Reverse transcriptase domain-containing protein n=1 Tax=Sesamum radiatum TaxID=300843 RepID=A0AAW2NTQ8_SESRA